jgi:hypothetical protein
MAAGRVPFSGYADDCTLSGEVRLDADRLSDFLSSTAAFEVDRVVARALDDGRIIESETAALLRDELCIVLATGPRGRPERRVWTRQLPVRVQVGPYVVLGYLHAPPTIDPIKSNERRAVVPLTSSVIQYTVAGQPMLEALDVALLVGRRIAGITYSTSGELAAAHVGVDPARAPDDASQNGAPR